MSNVWKLLEKEHLKGKKNSKGNEKTFLREKKNIVYNKKLLKKGQSEERKLLKR